MRSRTAAVLLLIGALLTGLAPIKQSWGEAKIPRIGILSFRGTNDDEVRGWLTPFRNALTEQGWIEGKSISFEFRSAQKSPSQPVDYATELVRLNVDVIFADSAPAVRAAHAATPTIPIVAIDFTTDPVVEGYVESYAQPGRNITGIFLDAPEFAGKWLQFLKAMIPRLSRVAVLWDPSPGTVHLRAVQKLARSFHFQLQVVEVREPDDLDKAFSTFHGNAQALVILPSPLTYTQSERLARLTTKYRLPAISMARGFAQAGGALAYGPELISVYERSGILVAKILSGAKPGDLPIERPTKVQLVVNLKTAKALGWTVPESILYRADEVIR